MTILPQPISIDTANGTNTMAMVLTIIIIVMVWALDMISRQPLGEPKS